MGSFSSADLEYMFWAGIRNGSIGTIGTQGPAGGLITTAIAQDTNLDTLTVSGSYAVQTATSGANATAANMPINATGTLLVAQAGSPVNAQIQTYTTNTGNIYIRRKFSSAWSAWRGYASTRVDQTAGRAIYTWDDLNNREQLVYGDTGWRNIAADIVAPATCADMTMRRVGQLVTVAWRLLDTAAAGTVSIYTLPVGFRNSALPSASALRAGTIGTLDGVTNKVVSPFNGEIRILSAAAGQALEGSVSWFTNDSWPTSLPGTASGTIPNL